MGGVGNLVGQTSSAIRCRSMVCYSEDLRKIDGDIPVVPCDRRTPIGLLSGIGFFCLVSGIRLYYYSAQKAYTLSSGVTQQLILGFLFILLGVPLLRSCEQPTPRTPASSNGPSGMFNSHTEAVTIRTYKKRRFW